MKNHIKLRSLILCVVLPFTPLSVALFWDSWLLLRSQASDQAQTRTSASDVPRISHQAASDPQQDILSDNTAWYDTDGTPLFYSAWRVKPGRFTPEPTARSTPLKHGARVACWPSSGGIWIKHADVVDLEFLGLDRFDSTPRQFNQTAEDEFCSTLKMVGAEWWQLPPDFKRRGHLGKEQYGCETLESCFTPDVRNEFLLAWPETFMTVCYVPIALVEERGDESLGGYRNALTMEERCRVIMRLGGEVCRCKAECPELEYLDWSFRDPGEFGCDTPPIVVDLDVVERFDPPLTQEVFAWARDFCKRNGWKKL